MMPGRWLGCSSTKTATSDWATLTSKRTSRFLCIQCHTWPAYVTKNFVGWWQSNCSRKRRPGTGSKTSVHSLCSTCLSRYSIFCVWSWLKSWQFLISKGSDTSIVFIIYQAIWAECRLLERTSSLCSFLVFPAVRSSTSTASCLGVRHSRPVFLSTGCGSSCEQTRSDPGCASVSRLAFRMLLSFINKSKELSELGQFAPLPPLQGDLEVQLSDFLLEELLWRLLFWLRHLLQQVLLLQLKCPNPPVFLP